MKLVGLFSLIMMFFILLMLFIGFVYLYLFIAKKQSLLIYQGYNSKKRKSKKTIKDKMLSLITSWSVKAGPIGIKYPFFADIDKHTKMLKEAGNPLGLQLQDFFGLRFVLGFMGLFFGTVYTIIGLPFGLQVLLLSIIGGFLGPSGWLHLKAKYRQETISIMMPDFLDTVSVTLQAGVSLDGALSQVTMQFEGPLSEEIEQFNKEVELGVPRLSAYQSLIDRNSSKELHSLVNSLIQGSSLGVPVSKTFKLQADDLRSTRGFTAKEKAAKASPLITLVTTFFIAPAVFGLIIGLLVLNIIYNPGAFGLDSFFF